MAMNPELKAIETSYNGYRFRSRLEARWAVFMDALGIPYEYEREGYDLEGVWYLPDFWLPQMQAHLEIKPDVASDEEWKKATLLAKHSRQNVFMLCGQPAAPTWNCDDCESQATLICPIEYGDSAFNKETGEDYHYLWCECPHCGRCELQFDGRADRVGCKCPKSEHGDKGYNFESPRLQAAYTKARGHRFEERGAK